MQQADKFKKLGIKPPKGALMYGPPGTSSHFRNVVREWWLMRVYRYRKDITRPCLCGTDECMLSETRRSFPGSSEFSTSDSQLRLAESTVLA
jgi:hypothetical protein